MEKYIINGQGFDVDPQDLEAFLKMYPGAKKYEPGKTIDSTTMDPIGESNIMGSNLAPSFTPVYKNNQEVTWQQAKDDIDVYKTLSRDEKRS